MSASHDPVEHGWHVHEAIQTWTNQSEVKATILLPVESALFVFFGSRLLNGKLPEEEKVQGTGWLAVIAVLGLLLLFYGLGCLILAVVPRLRRHRIGPEALNNAIYFGHIKGLEVDRIEQLLVGPTVVEQLARQLKVSSNIAWTKHRWLQASMMVAAVGLFLLVLSYVVAHFMV